jgi:SAM-dependent methyltransferase
MPRPAPPTFADACERLLLDPDGDHSLYTTLAPLYNKMLDDAHFDAQFEAVRAFAPEAGDALELGCGVGGLLAHLTDRYDRVVGVDRNPPLLRYTARSAPTADVVAADATRLPLSATFDVVVSFEYLAAHLDESGLERLLDSAADRLAPGGSLLVDSVVDPVAVREDAVGVYRGSNYRLERAVTDLPASDHPGVDLKVDYRATDERTGESAIASETLPVHVHDEDTLRAAADAAGLTDVRVVSAATDEGAVVLFGRKPE